MHPEGVHWWGTTPIRRPATDAPAPCLPCRLGPRALGCSLKTVVVFLSRDVMEFVASVWYRRMSLIYATGAWTLVGSICFSTWKRKQALANEEVLKDEDSVEKAENRRGFYVETIVTYKENFIPFSTRFYNYWKSWSNGPGPSE